MINKFTLGLGFISHPFDVGGWVSIAPVYRVPAPGGTRMNIVVDHAAKPVLGNLNIPTAVPYHPIVAPPPTPVTIVPSPVPVPAPLPRPLSAIGKVANPRPAPSPIRFVPDVLPQVLSAESSPAPYEVIFNDFQLEAVPFYNFWTDDETTNDKEDRGDRALDDVPRFIKVSWQTAPVISGQTRLGGKAENGKGRKAIRPIKFGTEAEKAVISIIKGVAFSPDHLQPQNFSDILGHLANGHYFPGVVHSTVELPVHNTGLDSHAVHANTLPIQHLDEDAFLTHPDTKGVSIHELKANIHQLTNGALGAARVSKTPLSRAGTKNRDSFFSGRFSVSRSPYEGDDLQLHGAQADDGPVLSLRARTARSSEGEKFDHVVEMASKVVKPQAARNLKPLAQVKVSFVNPSIGGAISEKKTNMMSEPHHAESVVAVAQMLPKLEVLKESGILDLHRNADVPSFPSPPGLYPVEYIGYVLEKYKQNDAGAFELVDTIKLPSIEYDTYIDCKVTYGTVYRYRIRAIMRWTREIDLESVRKKLLARGIAVSGQILSPFESSYFAGEWSPGWSYATVMDTQPPDPPDELLVRPESGRKRIAISFKLPYNPQRDIYIMRLFRKLQDADGRDLTGWTQVYQHNAVDRKIDFAPQNVLYYDTELVDYFQVNGIRYLYTAQCISRHHEYSAFSDQLACRLNSEFGLKGEFPVEFVSCAGVKPEHFGAFGVYPHKTFRTEIIAVPPPKEPTRPEQPVYFSFGGRNADGSKALDDALYFIRVESLDTGEKQDIQLNLTYNNQKTQTDVLEVGVYVPTHGLETERDKAEVAYGDGSVIGQLGDKGKPAEVIDKPLPPGRL